MQNAFVVLVANRYAYTCSCRAWQNAFVVYVVNRNAYTCSCMLLSPEPWVRRAVHTFSQVFTAVSALQQSVLRETDIQILGDIRTSVQNSTHKRYEPSTHVSIVQAYACPYGQDMTRGGGWSFPGGCSGEDMAKTYKCIPDKAASITALSKSAAVSPSHTLCLTSQVIELKTRSTA